MKVLFKYYIESPTTNTSPGKDNNAVASDNDEITEGPSNEPEKSVSPKPSPPALVGINFDIDNMESNKSKQKIVKCIECNKSLNSKSLAKHMFTQHQKPGPGKPRTWSTSDSGKWVKSKGTH